ncbi:unnamed protein product [Schistocephalus solidus]|uniref:Reverse transcriptase domain-containing protein n=1 Tax=Schistocephalus solidus TaxID=70667 RepID=A0A183S971_SCHSO|nr:unnamed protein product [Schistocephalus solidus]
MQKFGCPERFTHMVRQLDLWKVMQKFGCPEWFTHMVRQLHKGMTARVTDNGTHLNTTFVDLTKAFDTVNRDALWFMQKFGYPERFTHMVRQLHDGMMARVTNNGTHAEIRLS